MISAEGYCHWLLSLVGLMEVLVNASRQHIAEGLRGREIMTKFWELVIGNSINR